MPLDTTGISNENEFYTDHYLSSILENDLKEIFSSWQKQFQEQGTRPPAQLLNALPKSYFRLKARLEKTRRLSEILEAEQTIIRELLDALGYRISPVLRSGESGTCIPVLAEIRKPDGSPNLWIVEAVSQVAEPEDPLQLNFIDEQYTFPSEESEEIEIPEGDLSEIITREIFGLKSPPRWVDRKSVV